MGVGVGVGVWVRVRVGVGVQVGLGAGGGAYYGRCYKQHTEDVAVCVHMAVLRQQQG